MEENSSQYVVVLVTVASLQQGEAIARTLLDEKLAACINVFPVDSWYLWQGSISSEREYQLTIKTDINLFSQLADKIKTLHDYEVPEIIALPIVAGSKPYLNWLGDNLKQP
ncbi:MAG: divalent-cation tolerance protein CutA [Pleurocapsa sp. MO_226.B13]|nr:divalent-cation tolerance protein CutA [Pleurocapsa sp. MO_226.B13]